MNNQNAGLGNIQAGDYYIGQYNSQPLIEDDMTTYQNAGSLGNSINTVYIPSTTTNTPNITISPNTNGVGSSNIFNNPSTWTWSSGTANVLSQPTYAIFKLPRKKMPEKVFVQGMLKTCGLLGTDVECAYTDKDVIIFSPGVIPHYDPSFIYLNLGGGLNKNPTISIEYHNAIYHYVVDRVPLKGDKSTILDVRQVGMVKKGR